MPQTDTRSTRNPWALPDLGSELPPTYVCRVGTCRFRTMDDSCSEVCPRCGGGMMTVGEEGEE